MEKLRYFFISSAIILNISYCLYADSQDIKFQHISIEQGLSQNSVNCILQDSIGFLWFATYGGLNRYDGSTFKIYQKILDDPNSIRHSVIFALHEDRKGDLWVGSWGGGLAKLDRKKENFINYLVQPGNPHSLSDNRVIAIYEDRFGMLWIGTEGGGLNQFDRKNKNFIHYRFNPDDPDSLSHDSVSVILEDHNGVLWIGTKGGGLNKFDRGKGKFIRYQHSPGDCSSLSNDIIWTMHEDRFETLWIGTEGGLNKFNKENGIFQSYKNNPGDPHSLTNNVVRSIFEDSSGILWIGTNEGGLNKFNRDKEKFFSYRNTPNDPFCLSSDRVKSIYEDHSGILWIGTEYGGLNKINKERMNFGHYLPYPQHLSSTGLKNVRSIYEDRSGILWIGTLKGLIRLNRKTENYTHYKCLANNPNSLSNNYVTSILEDSYGMLWIGTWEGGLNRFDRNNETFTHYRYEPNDPGSLSNNIVLSIYEDRFKELWIGTDFRGLDRFDREKERFIHFRHNPEDPKSISNNIIMTIYEDRSGGFWIGTYGGGLNKFDRKNETFIHYMYDPNDPNSISHDIILSIHEDKTGTLWIGTSGGGLNKFNRRSSNFTRYRMKENPPNSLIYGILEDNDGYLWISTNSGLVKFDPVTETLKSYNAQDGLQSNEFMRGAYYKSRSGEMFFGGINGFNAFFPHNIKDNPNRPPVVITDFQLFNKPVSIEEMIKGRSILKNSNGEIEKIELLYKDNVFSFEFAALDYRVPEKNQYAYKMEGFEEDWNYIGTRRFTSFTNLPPGDYIFRVKGSNNDGLWNEESVSIKIIISPPLWKTWWAYCIYFLIISAVIFGYLYHRAKTRRRKFEEQLNKEREKAKIKALQLESLGTLSGGIAHDFNNLLQIITANISLVKDENSLDNNHFCLLDNAEIACGNATKLANKLISLSKGAFLKEKILSFSKILKNANDTLSKELEIYYNIDIPKSLYHICGDEEQLTQAISNILHNAVESMPDKKIVIIKAQNITLSNDNNLALKSGKYVNVTIEDRGCGISEQNLEKVFDPYFSTKERGTQKGMGLGLTISHSIIKMHKGDISIETEAGRGTRVTLYLPASHVEK